MTGEIELRPGMMPLADWRAIYRGAAVVLDPFARPDVEAGHAALTAIVARNDNIAPTELTNGSGTVVDLIAGRGEALPHGVLRLYVALKLASLGQGMSGMRWSVLRAIAEFLSQDLLPVISAQEASDKRAHLRLFAAMTGNGEVLQRGRVRPAAGTLKKARLNPLALNQRERRALLSGTQLSVATGLAGLFEAERVFQSAVVAAALTATAKPEAPFFAPAVHRLYRQRGQIDVAAAFRALLGTGAQTVPVGAPDIGASREAHRMGACLDLLRQGGATLERAGNAVTEDLLVVWQSEEIVAGVEDISSLAAASDVIALGLTTLGALCEARIATLASPSDTSEPAPTEEFQSIAAKASSFVAENRARGEPSGLDPAALRRLAPMAGTTALVVAIELLGTLRTGPEASGEAADRLGDVRQLVREAAPPARETGAVAAGNLASVAVLVGSGALTVATGIDLPAVAPRQPERPAFRLGVRRKGT